MLVQQGVDDPAHQQAYLEQYNAQLQAFMWEQQQQQLFAQQQAAAAAAKAGPEPEAQVAVAESRAGAGAGGKKPSRFGLSAMLATFDVGGKKEAARLEAEAAAPAPTAKTAPMAASKAAPPALAFASPFAHESGEVSAGVAAAAAAAAEAVGHDPELLAGLRECCAATKGLNLRAIFKQYDKGGDNSLNRKEFTAFLSKSGVKLGKSQFDKLVKLLDPDGSGELSYPKFTKFMRVFRAEHEAEDADVKETRRRQKAALQKLQDDRNASKAANFRRRGAAPEPEEAPKAASETERSAGLEKLWVKVRKTKRAGNDHRFDERPSWLAGGRGGVVTRCFPWPCCELLLQIAPVMVQTPSTPLSCPRCPFRATKNTRTTAQVSQYVSSGPGAVSGSTGVALLEDMFERFDVDGDGQLTTEELVDGLSSAGITTSKKVRACEAGRSCRRCEHFLRSRVQKQKNLSWPCKACEGI